MKHTQHLEETAVTSLLDYHQWQGAHYLSVSAGPHWEESAEGSTSDVAPALGLSGDRHSRPPGSHGEIRSPHCDPGSQDPLRVGVGGGEGPYTVLPWFCPGQVWKGSWRVLDGGAPVQGKAGAGKADGPTPSAQLLPGRVLSLFSWGPHPLSALPASPPSRPEWPQFFCGPSSHPPTAPERHGGSHCPQEGQSPDLNPR